MKCFVLAGGSSDRLWPLSRKNHPKQFMELREHRSMFQETIVRNLPFCDEFVIISNRRYENIISGQLRSFQHLNYSFVFEDENAVKGTALPIVMALLRCKKEEEVMIVASDSIIEGDYNQTIIALREESQNGKIGVVGCAPVNDNTGYNFLAVEGDKLKGFFKENESGKMLWDCGIAAGKVKNFLKALDSDYLEKCKMRSELFNGIVTIQIADGIESKSFSTLLHTGKISIIPATFEYNRITDLRSYNDYKGKKQKEQFSVQSASKNVDIVNMEDGKTVILNDVSDLFVVNTRDALYISSHENVADIKKILNEQRDVHPSVFNESGFVYESWGYKETLYYMKGYRFLKEVIYPMESMPMHSNTRHQTIVTVAKGSAIITLGGKKRECKQHESIFVPVGQKYRIDNRQQSELVLMVTRMGEGLMEDDSVRDLDEVLVKLSPCLKECIWGGTEIGRLFKKPLGGRKNIGESWELSTHPAGESVVASGKYKGKTLRQFIDIVGKERLGWKAQAFAEFPLMIKFIDSNENLSVQVHPNDEYAFPHEKQYGKNEMWYIVSAKPGAFIYAGFNRKMTRAEVALRIANNTIEEVLQKIPVKAGETYFLKAGTVHSIGAGCLICEIQQSSNVTYRMYDYDRKDKYGNKRELHVSQALDVMNYSSSLGEYEKKQRPEPYRNGSRTLLGECKYFTATKYSAEKTLNVSVGYGSFIAFVVLEGAGRIVDETGISPKTFKKGDTFFGVAQSYTLRSKGKIEVIAVTL